ncbi:MAG: accessory gene regulator B family protein [Armatimonadetes bacterium]|nr:accessory gene regulator B family protein [Armatimonadota bacterium]
MIHNLAVRLAAIIATELKIEERRNVIAYGLEIIIGALVKLLSFIALPLALGVFPQVVAAALAGGVFRLAAGGAHCTAYYRCLVSSLATFTGTGALARCLAGYSLPLEGIVAGAAVWSFVIALRWAPADTPAKPINNPRQRRVLKIASLLIVVIYFAAGLFASFRADLLLAASFGLFIQAFTVTPAGYRFIDAVDRLLSRPVKFPAGIN